MRLKTIRSAGQIVCSVWFFLSVQALAAEASYTLTFGSQYEVCNEFSEVLNQVELDGAYTCKLPTPPERSPIRSIEWKEVDLWGNERILKKAISQGQNISEEEKAERAQPFLEEFTKWYGRGAKIEKGLVKFDPNQSPTEVYKISLRVCEQDNEEHKSLYSWPLFYVEDIGGIDFGHAFSHTTNDIFRYDGRFYSYSVEPSSKAPITIYELAVARGRVATGLPVCLLNKIAE